jgi:2-keto-4-pentenoate hydratase/2-oxohepta-3-ene-1,7-dioic acid hydratase in catechol pathway
MTQPQEAFASAGGMPRPDLSAAAHDASRRDVMLGGVALAAAAAGSASAQESSSTSAGRGAFDEVAKLGVRIANLRKRDRVPDPNDLKLKTVVNGQTRQDWSTNDMIFDCRKLISFASGIMTLKPGDIMFTGTPQGVIFGEKTPREERRWLKAGDEITSSLEGLGELRFKLA